MVAAKAPAAAQPDVSMDSPKFQTPKETADELGKTDGDGAAAAGDPAAAAANAEAAAAIVIEDGTPRREILSTKLRRWMRDTVQESHREMLAELALATAEAHGFNRDTVIGEYVF